jgi:hypothetical protein
MFQAQSARIAEQYTSVLGSRNYSRLRAKAAANWSDFPTIRTLTVFSEKSDPCLDRTLFESTPLFAVHTFAALSRQREDCSATDQAKKSSHVEDANGWPPAPECLNFLAAGRLPRRAKASCVEGLHSFLLSGEEERFE